MSSIFDLGRLSEADRFVMTRVSEWIRQCQNGRPRYSAFLDSREQQLAVGVLEHEQWTQYRLFGGYDDAERKMLCVYAYDDPPEEDAFPFETLTVRSRQPFTHRDLLGSLMGLRIARESLGDLVIGDRSAVVFATTTTARIIRESLLSVGRASVTVEEGGEPENAQTPDVVECTVQSPRLDAVLAAALHLSREKAQQMVKAGLVRRNHVPTQDTSLMLQEGDLLSVSGFGRCRIASFGAQSRKGRQFLELWLYHS